MSPSVVQVLNGTGVVGTAATVTATLTNAIVAGDVVVALVACNSPNGDHTVAGLGATWTRVGKDTAAHLDLWIGAGATTTGTVTATLTVAPAGGTKFLSLWHVRGTSSAYVGGVDNATGDTLVSTAMTVGSEQIFIGSGYAESAGLAFQSPAPATGWVDSGPVVVVASRIASRVHRIPTATESHYFSTTRTGGAAHPIVRLVIGTGPVIRTNHVKNPSFENDLSGYVIHNATFVASHAASEGHIGADAVRLMHIFGDAVRPISYGYPADASTITLPSSAAARVSLYAKGSATANANGVRLVMHIMNASGVWSSDVATNITLTSTWTRYSVVTSTIAAGWKVGFSIDCGGGDFYVDGVLLEIGDAPPLGSYFDGSTAGAAWTGAAHASTSTLEVPVAITVSVKHYEAGAFVARTAAPKVYVNGAWVTKRPKRWNGSAWVDLP